MKQYMKRYEIFDIIIIDVPQSIVPADITVRKGAAIVILFRELLFILDENPWMLWVAIFCKMSRRVEFINLGKYIRSLVSQYSVLDLGVLI